MSTLKLRNIIILITGLLMLGLSFLCLRLFPETNGILRTLPYLCIGLGCGAFGLGLSNLINQHILKNSPEIQRQMDIEQKDERNTAIANRAKAKAFDTSLYLYAALMLAFSLLEIDLSAILLLTASYLFVVIYSIYLHCKYEKEM